MLRAIVVAAACVVAGAVQASDVGKPVFVPLPSSPALAGDLALSIGGLWIGGNYLYTTFDALGRVNMPLNGNRNLEIEAGAGAVVYDPNSYPAYEDAIAHLWGMRKPTAALGLYGGAIFGNGDIDWTLGVEGKHFLAAGSWGFSAGAIGCGDCGRALGAFMLSYNHYFNPNHRIGVYGAVLTDFNFALWEVGAEAEHRFMHPVSLFANVTYVGGTGGPSGYVTAKGGVRFFLDAPDDTIQSHERKVPWQFWLPREFTLVVG